MLSSLALRKFNPCDRLDKKTFIGVPPSASKTFNSANLFFISGNQGFTINIPKAIRGGILSNSFKLESSFTKTFELAEKSLLLSPIKAPSIGIIRVSSV